MALGEVLIIALLALSWGGSNRLRGWGSNEQSPKWQQFLTAQVFNRYTTAAWHGITAAWYMHHLTGLHTWPIYGFGAVVALLWYFAVVFGWGEYQDGQVPTNDEIGWIDWWVIRATSILPARFARAHWIDGISMGLRGLFYVPMHLACGLIAASWWFALPAAFFWQAGVVYVYVWKNTRGDFVLVAEWVDDTIRGLLFFAAAWFAFS